MAGNDGFQNGFRQFNIFVPTDPPNSEGANLTDSGDCAYEETPCKASVEIDENRQGSECSIYRPRRTANAIHWER